MGRFLKIWAGIGLFGLGLAALVGSTEAQAGTIVVGGARPGYVSPYYYPQPYYYPSTVMVEPLLLPRTGSNDYLYQYDNVYGAGASAAGRMDRVVNNPQPYLFYPRQPRVYIGY